MQLQQQRFKIDIYTNSCFRTDPALERINIELKRMINKILTKYLCTDTTQLQLFNPSRIARVTVAMVTTTVSAIVMHPVQWQMTWLDCILAKKQQERKEEIENKCILKSDSVTKERLAKINRLHIQVLEHFYLELFFQVYLYQIDTT